MRAIFEFRREILKRDKPILIISHWDMDHIHCLRYADQQTIKDCFSKFICIDVMRSVTSHNVYNKVRTALGDKMYFVYNQLIVPMVLQCIFGKESEMYLFIEVKKY